VDNGVFAKENDLAGGRDDNVLWNRLLVLDRELGGTLDELAGVPGTDKGLCARERPRLDVAVEQGVELGALDAVDGLGDGLDRASNNKRVLEVVEKIAGVLDTKTQADEVLGQTALSADGGRNRRVPVSSQLTGTMA